MRWVKDRTRTLLLASKLPVRLWPAAAEAATAIQRSKVLGWKSRLLAPFGAVVHVKQKTFDSSGPRRRERAFETKWIKGTYVGLSNLLDEGHVVYVPEDEKGKEKFIHTFHVRPRLIDPGLPHEELQVEEAPAPRRRVVGKMPLESIEMRRMELSEEELGSYVRDRCKVLLENWDRGVALQVVDEVAETGFFDDKKFGVYRHGGTVGWLRGLHEHPELTRVLTRIVTEINPEANYMAIWVARNAERGMHKDSNNDEKAFNTVIPVRTPVKGGDLWVELSPGDIVTGEVMEREDDQGRRRYGQVYRIRAGSCMTFLPRKLHEVLPWSGTRTVLIAYTPNCFGSLSREMIQNLEDYGFLPPPSQLPEYFLKKGEAAMNYMEVDSQEPGEVVEKEEEVKDEEDESWEMFLEAENGMIKIGGSVPQQRCETPSMKKMEPAFTKDVEDLLNDLVGPLEVTHNVDPREVEANWEKWIPAIMKELTSVSVAIQKLPLGSPERSEWIQRPGAQRLPTKMVYTIKPGDNPDIEDPSTWYKRKARLVVCGNFADRDQSDLYSETAPSEAVRAGLVMSRRRKWAVGLIDVVAAFLRTPMDQEGTGLTIIVTPPRTLEKMKLIDHGELWGLVRALYGLRQAPALWSAFRDKTLKEMKFPDGWTITRGRTVTSWWVFRNRHGSVMGVLICYVDDFLLLSQEQTIRELAETIQQTWKTSPLAILRHGEPVRFLGMELHLDSTGELIYVSQHGYVEEILRENMVGQEERDRIPLSREKASFEVGSDDEEPSPEKVAAAQRLTGEIMWLSQKTRPDLSFACSLMASITLKAPMRCIDIAHKILRYLRATGDYKMAIRDDGTNLTLYPDAAFAPSSNRSHTGWVICWSGTPLAWRSARQATVALSTGESELLAILDGAVGLMGVEAMLMDLFVEPETKTIASDSTSALAIGSGTGSWRTRHLRLKAAWLQERIADGDVVARHQPGITQPADLLTKALSGQRIRDLLALWGVGQEGETRKKSRPSQASLHVTRAMVAMLCCLMVLGVESREEEGSQPPMRLQLDWDLVGVFLAMLTLLGAVMIYEALRWGVVEFYREYTPGAAERKVKRLRKLQEVTAAAIEEELRKRAQQFPGRHETSRPVVRERSEPRSSTARPETPSGQDDPATSLTAWRTSSPTPTRSRSEVWLQTPTTPSTSELDDPEAVAGEAKRAIMDTVMLMRVEDIREGLRMHGLQLSGLKQDLATRLADVLVEQIGTSAGPTVRQYRYLLWLWRHKDLHGKVLLKWSALSSRHEASRTIHQWKSI